MFVLGVPVYRQRYRTTASAPAAERFYSSIRATCALQEGLRQPFDGCLELDESMFGGKRPGKRGWGASGKVIVFGILKRNGMVQVSPLEGRGHRE
jgi:transposase